jgi:hypothetical protein
MNRYWDARALERQAEEQKRTQTRLPADLNTDQLKILQFYASPPQIRRGEKALLCYGVLNARSVRIEPGTETLTPAVSRCIEVTADKSTEFKITAVGATGNSAQASVRLQVGETAK